MWHSPAGGTVTPEAVRLRTDVAGIGSRTIALTIDAVIQAIVLVPLLFVISTAQIGGIGGMTEFAVAGLAAFAVLWLYFPIFEWLNQGQTPGKRAQRIRVVRTTGEPAGFAAVMVRNLLRIVEVYAFPFIAILSMFFTSRVQRLGDLAAGTMVVRDRALPVPEALDLGPPGAALPTIDTSGLTEREYDVLRAFLVRRRGLTADAAANLAAQLATVLRRQLGEQPAHRALSNEELIYAAVRSYRARFGNEREPPGAI